MAEADGELSPEPRASRATNWSRYWASGAHHSCSGSFGPQYEGAIRDWWLRSLRSLPVINDALDLATGGGAVLRLLAESTPQARLTGVDIGEVSPPWLNQLTTQEASRVSVRGGIDVEQLPFSNAAFDLVTSQFGIEYANLNQALAEVRRVLRPEASLLCVLHHAESRIVELARWEAEHIAWLLSPGGWVEVSTSLCPLLELAATPEGRAALARDQAAGRIRQRFNALQDERIEKISASACPDILHAASDIFGQVMPLCARQDAQAAESRLHRFAQDLRDSEFRLRDLARCALTPTDVSSLRQGLEDLDFQNIHMAEMRHSSGLMGWSLSAQVPESRK